MSTVYLAGPISGLDYAGAVDWREATIRSLAAAGIRGLSPMRAKEYLSGMKDLDKNCVEYGKINVLSSPRGIMARDYFDVTHCDLVLINFRGADRISMGTVMEVAWAYMKRVPVIAVMEAGNVHEHAMITQAIDYRVDTLDEAVALAKAILTAYNKDKNDGQVSTNPVPAGDCQESVQPMAGRSGTERDMGRDSGSVHDPRRYSESNLGFPRC